MRIGVARKTVLPHGIPVFLHDGLQCMLPCLSLHTHNATEPPHPCECRIAAALGNQPDCSPNGPDDIDDIKEGIKKETSYGQR